jgi:hypothetical protein
MAILSKTLQDAGFDGIFTEVLESQDLGLLNPHELRMFCLNTSNNAFSFDAMQEFLLDNIGSYIYSRAKIDQFILDGKERNIGMKALSIMRRASNMDTAWLGEQLGDILLYVFLEKILDAPKLYSKIELLERGGTDVMNGGGVHLLEQREGFPAHQLIFGKSHVVGDIKAAIDAAFTQLEALKADEANELRLVESIVLSQEYPAETAKQLKSLLVPSKQKSVPDKSFGVFLGYSLGLKPEEFSRADFGTALTTKMELDIKAHTAYIISKINAAQMSTYSIYFYILPFNDAVSEKESIMKALLEGGA